MADGKKCLPNMKWARGTAFISSTKVSSPMSRKPRFIGEFLPVFLGFGTLIHLSFLVSQVWMQAIKCCTSSWRLH